MTAAALSGASWPCILVSAFRRAHGRSDHVASIFQTAGLCDTSMPMPFPKDVTPASREELRLSVVGTDAARAVRDGSHFVT